MAKKANGKIRKIKEGQVIMEIPLPVADVLRGIPDADSKIAPGRYSK